MIMRREYLSKYIAQFRIERMRRKYIIHWILEISQAYVGGACMDLLNFIFLILFVELRRLLDLVVCVEHSWPIMAGIINCGKWAKQNTVNINICDRSNESNQYCAIAHSCRMKTTHTPLSIHHQFTIFANQKKKKHKTLKNIQLELIKDCRGSDKRKRFRKKWQIPIKQIIIIFLLNV